MKVFNQIVFWTIILVIGWFIFSGGLFTIADSFNTNDKFKTANENTEIILGTNVKTLEDNEIKVEVKPNTEVILSTQFLCDFFKQSMRSQGLSFKSGATQVCSDMCRGYQGTYVGYKCDFEFSCVCDDIDNMWVIANKNLYGN